MSPLLVQTDNESDTEALGARLAAATRGHAVLVFLRGALGAGKTTLARGFLRGLGHTGPVKSPTYTLVEPYPLAPRPVFHFDLYRLSAASELEDLGIRDYLDGRSVLLIEWPERGAQGRIDPDVEVHIQAREGGRRELRFTACGRLGTKLLERMRHSYENYNKQ
ncbi:MAG: tRNA (adenosine(37)-N6)-threonylcarbamoyltransferase complex ATPase subunit type 1 TsaE [Gammaproteobacteria bacterium]